MTERTRGPMEYASRAVYNNWMRAFDVYRNVASEVRETVSGPVGQNTESLELLRHLRFYTEEDLPI